MEKEFDVLRLKESEAIWPRSLPFNLLRFLIGQWQLNLR
ncbi:Uncharacterised protein [Yersinia frederiksenii]|uniref:Uncharacterized protein n=1 Tax=Yersinia frederiksenii TaxID=29484 RepID=A0AAI8ZR35_YERFR|nr:Uncharacterised protein [Yersinia frederiksenii]CFR14187.1 Uncharacterised protein [Yersinia frederiksenii]CNG19054.1 Uncharacterised protein [Yersinia frederiksenii]CNL53686.1 Uncharacterised protein [Yersinia frederiksenii]CQH43534.1 Uncharacterised protein [Yersinia frederiksenii]